MEQTGAWVHNGDIWKLSEGIELHVPLSLSAIPVNLPEDEMLLNYASDGRVTPHVAIQDLAGEFRFILHIDHYPPVVPHSLILRLKIKQPDLSVK
jgi:hypothetical protein